MITDFERDSASLGKDANNVFSAKRIDAFRKYRLLAHAQKLLIESEVTGRNDNIHRTRLCHNARAFQAESIAVRIPVDPRKNSAALAGVQTCGSIWACPCCAAKIASKRGAEISQIIDYMSEAGHVAIMVTNTARHHANMGLAEFKNKFKQAHRYFVQSRRWQDLKSKYGIQHSIKAVEGTWGLEHGWHYHQHAILFLNADLLQKYSETVFSVWVIAARALWLDCLAKVGLDGIGEIAFDVQAEHDVKKTYLAKLGLEDETANLDYELSAGHNKTSGGAKIWQILEKSWHGDKQASDLYIEWVEAMSGDKWITFSHGLKDLCGIAETEDEDLAVFDGIDEQVYNETLIEISDDEFMPVRKLQKLADLLELAATSRNAETVRKWLADLYREWDKSHAAAERDRMLLQYQALDRKIANMRMGYNKRNEHPAPDSSFWSLVADLRQLKKRLEIQ